MESEKNHFVINENSLIQKLIQKKKIMFVLENAASVQYNNIFICNNLRK